MGRVSKALRLPYSVVISLDSLLFESLLAVTDAYEEYIHEEKMRAIRDASNNNS